MSTARHPFSKVEGLGNDFVLLDHRSRVTNGAPVASLAQLRAWAPAWCDRRRGVGADGLLVVTDSVRAGVDAGMVVINADGSRPEMCGNGLRCVASHVASSHRDRHDPGTSTVTVCIETDAGDMDCRVRAGDLPTLAEVDVDMPPAVHGPTHTVEAAPEHRFHVIDMGNPHAVAFVDDPAALEALARGLGPAIERAPQFPAGTNVEFVHAERPDRLRTWVWERGCGITQACGTGACAVAAAAVAQGHAAAGVPLEVVLPGGSLFITVPSQTLAALGMRGPAREVFTGHLMAPTSA